MDAAFKIVTRLPLQELWGDGGFVTTARGRFLTVDDIAGLLRSGPVHFVVADVGAAPTWIPTENCFVFWKTEVKPHLSAVSRACLEAFPDNYCYFASEWSKRDAATIVVLEKQH